MIYSKFGTVLTPVSKSEDAVGRISVQVTVEGTTDFREYQFTDLKADRSVTEINETVAALPWKVIERKPSVGRRTVASPQANRQR